jgi:hypothetical protein
MKGTWRRYCAAARRFSQETRGAAAHQAPDNAGVDVRPRNFVCEQSELKYGQSLSRVNLDFRYQQNQILIPTARNCDSFGIPKSVEF